jgi:hypothetical protein
LRKTWDQIGNASLNISLPDFGQGAPQRLAHRPGRACDFPHLTLGGFVHKVWGLPAMGRK